MAIYARTQTTENNTQTMTSTKPLASQEISDVIVRSLESVADTLEEQNDESTMEKYEEKRFEVWKKYFEELKKDKNNPFNFANYSTVKSTDNIKDKNSQMMSLLEGNNKDSKENTKINKQLNNLLLVNEKDKKRRSSKDDKDKDIQKKDNKDKTAAIGKIMKGLGVASLALGVISANTDSMKQGAKRIVLATGLIVAVGSQLIVLAKAAIARFRANWPVVKTGIMAEVKSWFTVLPDKIRLSLEKTLSKVKILGQPLFSNLTQDEADELKDLRKKTSEERTMAESAIRTAGIDPSKYDLETEEGREAFKKEYKAKEIASGTPDAIDMAGIRDIWSGAIKSGVVKKNGKIDTSKGVHWMNATDEEKRAILQNAGLTGMSVSDMDEIMNTIDSNGPDVDLSEYTKKINEARSEAKANELLSFYTSDDYNRFKELSEKDKNVVTDETIAAEERALEAKQQRLKNQSLTDAIKEGMKAGTITEYQFNEFGRRYGVDTSQLLSDWKDQTGQDFVFADPTNAEKFLSNEYKAWQDSWEKMFKDLGQNIGITTTIKQEPNTSNPTVQTVTR